MFDRQQLGGVVDCAVTVVVVANRAVEEMITEYAVKGFSLRCIRGRRIRDDAHSC